MCWLRTASSLAALLVAASASGCSQVVVFDGYTYDIDPCGPQPPSCGSSRDVHFVIQDLTIPPTRSGRVRDGFDLDATDEPICGQPDSVSPEGEAGIDNQLAPLLELYEAAAMVDVSAERRAAHLRGEELVVIGLRGVDDLDDDDCVEVVVRAARVPAETPLEALDVDGDRLLDPGLALDLGPPSLRDATACIRDGVLHARFDDALTQVPGFITEVRSFRGRARLRLSPDPMTEVRLTGVLGGGIPVDDLQTALPAEVVEFLRGRADLRPSSRDARDCAAISWALAVDAVPATRAGSF
jgi:hypothetical protein